ncbi:hypothetical protein E2C01_097037 [Portunus trituberculatus]|uniref:Uncharacterized protein n=1 Tax=Portunus trituberculatus TaxID=210409 RepID=A0A5B7KA27_PORTR|nr:hypothetical protein [Portunus trituberculatus]
MLGLSFPPARVILFLFFFSDYTSASYEEKKIHIWCCVGAISLIKGDALLCLRFAKQARKSRFNDILLATVLTIRDNATAATAGFDACRQHAARSTHRHQFFAMSKTHPELLQRRSREQQARLIVRIGQERYASSSLALIARTHAPLDFFPTSAPLQLVDRYSGKYTGVLDAQQPNAFLLSLTNSIPRVSSRNFVIFLAEAGRSRSEGKESNGR